MAEDCYRFFAEEHDGEAFWSKMRSSMHKWDMRELKLRRGDEARTGFCENEGSGWTG